MASRPALALINCRDHDRQPATAEAVEFARYLARRQVRAMMADRKADSPRT